MPPKKQITGEKILDKAVELTRKYGFENMTARFLAKELGCSTQPIYQAFADMNELKLGVVKRTLILQQDFMRENYKEQYTAELSMLLGYLEFAFGEPRLFQLIYTSPEVMELLQEQGERAEYPMLDERLIIFVNGLIMMSVFHTVNRSQEEMKKMVVEMYDLIQGKGK